MCFTYDFEEQAPRKIYIRGGMCVLDGMVVFNNGVELLLVTGVIALTTECTVFEHY